MPVWSASPCANRSKKDLDAAGLLEKTEDYTK